MHNFILHVISLTLAISFILPATVSGVPYADRATDSQNGAVIGGGTNYLEKPSREICVTPETRELIRARVKSFDYQRTFERVGSHNSDLGLSAGFTQGISSIQPSGVDQSKYAPHPTLYPFYPQGGTLYRDLLTGNFVDLNPTAGSVTNYLCENYGNDSHQGIDTAGMTWEEMAIGQPVYAARDGIVIDAHDGDPDMNTSCQPGGNWVVIDHGDGREAWYLHLKKNSVTVTVGSTVRAGQEIGQVGSSGCSFAPHLHFQSMLNGEVHEPFSGPCNQGPSGWKNQIDPPISGAFVRDMGVTIDDIGMAPPLPSRAPVDNQIPLSAGGNIYYWIQFGNLPANSSWVERYIRPDGSVEYQIGPFGFGNPTTYQVSQYWFPRLVSGMATTPGTWRIQFEVNGVLLVDAPVEVVGSVSSSFNRAPQPIAVKFDPAAPKANQALFARVDAPAPATGYRDLDWDIVRYRYQWKVNGAAVRDVISAGMADALSSEYTKSGDLVQVTVTAGDGFGGGLGVTASPKVLTVQIP